MLRTILAAFRNTEPGFYRQLCRLAWPISAQLVLSSSLALVDVLMLSGQGSATVAAVGLAGKLFFVVILLCAGVANAAAILVAQYSGQQNDAGVRRVLLLGLCCVWLATLPCSLLCWLWPQQMMRWYANDPEVIAAGARFLQLCAPFHLLNGGVAVLAAVLRARHRAVLPMQAGLLAVLLNTGGNWLLIAGHAGAPALGLDGAALATIAAKSLELLLLLLALARTEPQLRLRSSDLRPALRSSDTPRFLRQALPLALNEGLWALGMFAFTLIYSHMGQQQLAAVSLLAPLEGICIDLFVGFSSAAAIMISTRLGAQRFDSAKRIAWHGALGISGAALLAGLLLLWLQPLVLMLFGAVEAPVLQLAGSLLPVLALTLWLRLANCVACVSILRSGGEVRFTLYVDLLVLWLLVLPACACAGLLWHWSLSAVYALALAGEGLLKLPLYLWRIGQQRWLRSLVDSPH